MPFTIRTAEERDAAAAARVASMVNPHFLSTPESWLHRRRTLPERAHGLWLVAQVDGEVVAQARAGLTIFTHVTDTGYVDIAVDEGFRRRGIGSALYERCESHAREIGAARLSTQFFEAPAGLTFAQSRAFEFDRASVPSAVDPRTVDLPLPADVELVAVGELPPEEIHHIDEAASRDEPSTDPITEIRYDEWLDFVWNYPTFSRDGSFAVLVDGRPVAMALLFVDLANGRATNAFTATLREHRGRGLALATKIASMRWAAANGITSIVTANDESNAPMLAINRKLGYAPLGRVVEMRKPLGL